MDGLYHCVNCGVKVEAEFMKVGKCEKCFNAFIERRKQLSQEGFFEGMKRLGSWKKNGVRGSAR